MNVLKDLPGGLPNIHVAVVSSDMGAGDGMRRFLLRHGRQRGIPVHAARDLHVDDAAARRDVHLQRRRVHELHRARHLDRVLVHRRARRRRAAASSARSRRCCARWAPTASPCRPRTRASCAPTRCWRSSWSPTRTTARRGAGSPLDFYDTRLRHQFSSPLRAAAELPLQRVRPPLRRRAAAAAWRRTGRSARPVTLQNCTSSECDGLLTPVAEFAARIKALKAAPASEIFVAAITGPSTPYHGALGAAERHGHVLRGGVVPVAADRALVHGCRRQLRRPGRSHRLSWLQRLRRERLRVVDLRRRLRARAAADRDADRHAADGGRRHGRPGRADSHLRGHRASVATPVRAAARRRRRGRQQRRRAARRSAATRAAGTGMSSGSGVRLSGGRRAAAASRASAPRARSSRGWRRGAGADVALRGTPSRA